MTEQNKNLLLRVVEKTARLPLSIRQSVLSTLFGKYVPYVGTSGVKYEEISPEKVIVSIKNRRHVQNHIKGVHAVAVALLAETATGFVTAMNLPNDKIVLIKTMTVNYKRPMKGDLRAVATLNLKEREYIANTPKGELLVPVVITDATGESPVEASMLWAWVTKKTLSN